MIHRRSSCVLWRCLGVMLASCLPIVVAHAQGPDSDVVRPFLWQPDMAASQIGEVNVFRRFSSDRAEAMREFYTSVLGLTPLPQTAAGGLRMIRYPVGASEIKLFPVELSDASDRGPLDVAGLRIVTLFYDDLAELSARFPAHGLTPPEFLPRGDGGQAALVRDPDGEWVELVVPAKREAGPRFEVAIAVTDLAASRAFYGGFLGLAESGPLHDALLGVDKYSFRHGTTTVHVFAAGTDTVSDVETAGLQYIVWDVEGVADLAERRAADIDRPLSEPGNMRTIWLRDPDGVSNYFAEFAGQDNSPPR